MGGQWLTVVVRENGASADVRGVRQARKHLLASVFGEDGVVGRRQQAEVGIGVLAHEAAAKDEGFADFRTQLAIRRRAAAGHVGKGAKVVMGSDVAVVQRRMDAAAPSFH